MWYKTVPTGPASVDCTRRERQVSSVSLHLLCNFCSSVGAGRHDAARAPRRVAVADLANERLWCGAQARPLRPKNLALLRYLVAHPGQVSPKRPLLEALWPATLVSEGACPSVSRAAPALGDDARPRAFIETVHRRGYRFVGQLPTGTFSSSHRFPHLSAAACRTRARSGRAARRAGRRPDWGPSAPLHHGGGRTRQNRAGRGVPHGPGDYGLL